MGVIPSMRPELGRSEIISRPLSQPTQTGQKKGCLKKFDSLELMVFKTAMNEIETW